LADSCPECGYAYDTPRDKIPNELRNIARKYRELLHTDPDRLRRHTAPGVWSPLEYAAHYRDVLRVQLERIKQAIKEDKPDFPSMRREERVTEERYNEQDPATVGVEIAVAADELASALERLSDKSWERVGIYHYPTTQERSVEWIACNTIHEGVHHLMDIERQLEGQSGS
jgi:hypothetical protein